MVPKSERTNWAVYTTAGEANLAAREEANSTGVVQYVVKKPVGFIITPDNAGDTSAASFVPPYDLDIAVTVQDKVPRALTATDVSEVEALARADATQDFYALLGARMYRLSPGEITEEHKNAVKEEVIRIKDRSSWGVSSAGITLKIVD